MAKGFLLDVVTPEERFFSGEVESVVVKTLTGEEGFLANHIWACKILDAGEMRIRDKGSKEVRTAEISGGYIDVHGDIMIFTDSAEWKE